MLFKKVWEDIKQGENIDLYITVFVAVFLTLFNLFGFTPQSFLAPITLAVLGLLAIATLGDRHRLEEILRILEKSATPIFIEEYPQGMEQDFLASEEVWLIGATLNRTIRVYYPLIERKLRKGDKLKVLLVHPDGAALDIIASRFYTKNNVERTRRLIYDTLQLLCDLRKIEPNNLEIRTIKTPLTFGAIAMNPEVTIGTLYIEHYAYKTVSNVMPKFVLNARDGHWYQFFNEEIHLLWENGNVWRCE